MKSQEISFTISKPERIYPTLTRLLRSSDKKKGALQIPFHLQSDWFLVLFEAIQNAFQHGGALKNREPVKVLLLQDSKWLEAKIYDRGEGFEWPKRSKKADLWNERGRGIAILKQLADRVVYARGKNENCLYLKKKILPPAKRYRVTDLLYEISHRLTEAPNLQKVYDIVLDKLIQVFNVERASIMIYDAKEAALRVVAARGLSSAVLKHVRVKGGEGVSGYVFERSKPLLIEDVRKSDKALRKPFKKYQSRSFISAPLITSPMKMGEETLGVINLTDKRDGGSFTRADLKLLTAIAHQAAAYVRIGTLIDRLKKAESIHRDLEIVAEIQRKLLPTRLPTPEGAEIAGEALLSPQGGGDYFDAVGDEREIYLVAADVTGHSLASALTMVNFRAAFRTLYLKHPSPKELLFSLNRMMFEDLSNAEHFICVSLVRFCPDSGKVTFAGAGSVPLFVFGKKRPEIESLPAQSFPLGVEEKTRFEEEVFQLKSGEGIFLATDGALDLKVKHESLLGVEGFKKLIFPYRKLSASLMVQRVKKNLKRKKNDTFPSDDITLLVAKKV